MLERWNTGGELDFFAAREWESQGETWSGLDERVWKVDGYEPSPGWWRELRARDQFAEYGPWGGGGNPLHLGHSDYMECDAPAGPSNWSVDAESLQAILTVNRFNSWQRELWAHGRSLPSSGDRSWRVDVIDRKLGFLGRFRQSRVTGLWFQGKHSIHMAGNPPRTKIVP